MAACIRWLAVVVWMSLIFVVSSLPSLHVHSTGSVDFLLRKLAHIGEYAVLTALLWWTLRMHTSTKSQAWLLAVLMTVFYALSDEWHQSWIVGRQGTVRDVGFDTLGMALGYVLVSGWSFHATRGLNARRSRRQCPACQEIRVYRSRRRGLLEWCSRLIRLAPYRCGTCDQRFWRFTWGWG
jgi:VanZ family protein